MTTFRPSAAVTAMGTYPFVRLDEAKAAAAARGVDVIDLGVGEPREETPAFIRRALVDALEADPVSRYPTAAGTAALRQAAAAWVARRFGAEVDPDTAVLPTLGSKEAVFGLAQAVGGATVCVPTPGYPVYARGASVAGKRVHELALSEARGWLPDLDGVPWDDDLAILWICSPGNPTAAVAPLEWLAEAAQRCRAAGAVLACDEAYSELWFGDAPPPPSALQLDDRRNVVVFHTLSKRSSMPGYRAGFLAGDPAIVSTLRRLRPSVGTAVPLFVQAAAAAAYGDEVHVGEARERYARKREVLRPALEALGLRPAGGDASFFVWLALPDGERDDERFAASLLERTGVVVTPGSFLGRGGEGHVRAALVPTLDRCEEAAHRLRAAGTVGPS